MDRAFKWFRSVRVHNGCAPELPVGATTASGRSFAVHIPLTQPRHERRMGRSLEGASYARSRCQRAFDWLGCDPDICIRTRLFPTIAGPLFHRGLAMRLKVTVRKRNVRKKSRPHWRLPHPSEEFQSIFTDLERHPLKWLVLILPKAFIEICSIPAVLVHEDVRVCQDLATLPDQESRALYSGTNHVADRLSELRDLSPRQAKFRPFDGQQTPRINPLAVTVFAANKIDLLKNTPGTKFGCS
jgi:hypothetical protein